MRSARIARTLLAAVLAAVAVVALASASSRAQTRSGTSHTASASPVSGASALDPDSRDRAEGLYERLCASCHGLTGRGDGSLARYLPVPPRDFEHQPFKWRATPSGSPPTVEDVSRTIARGVPGGAMPSFGLALRPGDRTLLARFILGMQSREAVAALPPPSDLAPTAERERRGAAVYVRLQCAGCHGVSLRGDGPNAAQQNPRPYDLTRISPRGGSDVAAIVRTLRTGIDGTGMPAFEGAAPLDDLVALAVWLSNRVARDPTPDPSRWLRETDAVALTTPLPTHLLDEAHARGERSLWALPLAPQGPGPAQLTPAERSLNPDRCGRCHAQQFAQFRATVHAGAMGPGVLGQLVDMPARDVVQCQICHAPLSEQAPFRWDAREASTASSAMTGGPANPSANDLPHNPDFDAELRPQGIVCAACHLRGRTRFGPPRREAAARLAGSLYPLTTLSRYERGDFCAPCHQHTAEDSAGGHPILDTVSEWIESPYFARGIECQHCHMPDRDHTWRGAHDPETVRQAVHVYARVAREGGEAVVSVHVENVGAGHAFPGTATPAAVLTLEWLDENRRSIAAPVRDVIQRRLEWDGSAFQQRFDTRIAPGAERAVEARTRDPRARALRYTLLFRPDDYYEGFYAHEIDRAGRSEQGRALLRQALVRAQHSPFVVRSDTLTLP